MFAIFAKKGPKYVSVDVPLQQIPVPQQKFASSKSIIETLKQKA